jgi:hypothetical protein
VKTSIGGLMAVIVLLYGCGGRDFVRPDPESLRNGQTTYAEVTQRLGKPAREGTVQKNDRTFKTASYVYSSRGGTPHREEITPARVLYLYFDSDTLVGHEFVSSFADDHTDFDEDKAKQLVKDKTTRVEALRIMGKPSGFYIRPLIKAPAKDAAVYMYIEIKASVFNIKPFQKTLFVSFDEADVVSAVEFSSLGTK